MPALPDATSDTASDTSSGDDVSVTPKPDRAGDAAAELASDAGRPTAKLTWTLMTPGWDADYISGAANGEIWIASKPSSVLQIRADGTSAQSSLMLLGSAHVTSLWVAGPNNAYASASANLVLHWDGSGTWKRDIMSSGLTFSSIWGTSSTDVYAVGGDPYHSAGDDRWTIQPVRETTIAGLGFIGGSGPTDLWIAGIYGEIFRSNGDGLWRLEVATRAYYVNQIWVVSPDEAYFVTYNTIMHRLPSSGRWVPDKTPVASTENMNCLWGSGPTDIYAGTDKGRLFHSVGDGVWDDEGFDPGVGVKLAIKGIWGPNAGDVYLATSNGIYHGGP